MNALRRNIFTPLRLINIKLLINTIIFLERETIRFFILQHPVIRRLKSADSFVLSLSYFFNTLIPIAYGKRLDE